jgi:hypothetical protein
MKNLKKLNKLETSNRLMYYNLYYEMTNEDTGLRELSTKGAAIGLTVANFLFWILGIKLFSLGVKHSFLFGIMLLIFSGVQFGIAYGCCRQPNKVKNRELNMSLEMCNVKDVGSFKRNVDTLIAKYNAMKRVYSSYNVDLNEYIDTMLTKYYNPESLLPSEQLNEAFDEVRASLIGE